MPDEPNNPLEYARPPKGLTPKQLALIATIAASSVLAGYGIREYTKPKVQATAIMGDMVVVSITPPQAPTAPPPPTTQP